MSENLKNPRAAWPFPVRQQLEAQSKTDTEASMCTELEAWCKKHGLPYLSADELIVQDLTTEQRAYVSAFMRRWDVMLSKSSIPDRVRKVIAATTRDGLDEAWITDHKNLALDLNMDSLDRFQLSIEIEDEFGIEITDAESAPLNTVGEIVALVESKVKS